MTLSIVSHLHQSDLLILDYKLDGDEADAEKSIAVLRNLARSDHFNLVIVYTQETSSIVFKDIVLSLLTKWESIGRNEFSTVTREIHKWEDENESILEQLRDCVTRETYLRARLRNSANIGECRKDPDLQRLIAIYKERPTGIRLGAKDLFNWLLHEAERDFENQLSPVDCGRVKWSEDLDSINWIRTNRLFITIIEKKDLPSGELPNRLLEALTAWRPEPPRLIMAKMRAELDARGVNAEDSALSDELIQAAWFFELLQASQDEFNSKISNSISRNWEGLLRTIEPNLSKFAKRLFRHLHCGPSEHKKCVMDYFGVNLEDEDELTKALLRQNAYNCSKAPEGWHLTTGHVLKIDDEYWVCLSPACDLEPFQKQSGRYAALSPTIPFKAVRLHFFGKGINNQKKALAIADNNICLFLNLEDSIHAFQFTTITIKKHLANPTWEEMFADNHGFLFGSSSVRIARLKWNNEIHGLKCEWTKATVVSQLRYEYAINLLQRLGNSTSRIGLDFLQHPKDTEPA